MERDAQVNPNSRSACLCLRTRPSKAPIWSEAPKRYAVFRADDLELLSSVMSTSPVFRECRAPFDHAERDASKRKAGRFSSGVLRGAIAIDLM